MITSLRRRHLRVWWFLAGLLPVILMAAWWSRRPAPVMDQLPAALEAGRTP